MKKVISKNKSVFHHYQVKEELETGISLTGSEVKSLRQGEVSLKGSYVVIQQKTLLLKHAHIKEYKYANIQNHEPKRDRILLAHKKEITRLISHFKKHQGTTLVPIELYFKKKWIKLKIALAVGKKLHDKRESIKKHDIQRDMDRYTKKSIYK